MRGERRGGGGIKSERERKNAPLSRRWKFVAEEEGFEPSLRGLRVKRFSRPPHSTTLPPLRMGCDARVFSGACVQNAKFARRINIRRSAHQNVSRETSARASRNFKWRRDGDSNPRYAFGAYTISNRAPSASSDISPRTYSCTADAATMYFNSEFSLEQGGIFHS